MNTHPLALWRDRQSPKLNKAALARFLGVSGAMITRLEAGRPPSLKMLKRITQATGIPAADLRPDIAEIMR